LEVAAPACAVRLDEVVVRKRGLRILVQVLHVRVRRRRIEIEVVLLHVLAVVRLAVGEAEQPFLDDGILSVPQRYREAEPLLVVGDAREAVLAPAVGARPRLIVAEVIPRNAALAVVFANGRPLAPT